MKKRRNWLLIFSAIMILLVSVESRAQDAIVAMYGSAEVDFIDLKLAKVVKRLKLKGRASLPLGIALTPDGKTAVVACENGYISFVDVVNKKVVKTLKLLRGPEKVGQTKVPNEFVGVKVTPDGKTALVTEVNEFGALFCVDIVNQRLCDFKKPLQLGDEPYQLAITSDGIYAYVVDIGLNKVLVVDVPNWNVIRSELVGAVGEPSDIVLTSDETRALIIDANDGWIYLVDVSVSPWTVLDKTQETGAFTEPQAIAMSPVSPLAIVANYSDESISFVSFAGDVLNIEKTIKVRGTPYGVAFTADGKNAVVSLFNTSSVAIIDVLNRSVSSLVKSKLGRAPSGVTIVSVP